MPPMLGAVGIGVSDMEKSIAFYKDTLQLGLAVTQTFDVAAFTETILAFPRGEKPTGSPIILMQYKNTPPPVNQLGKLVFYVEDVKEVFDRCKAYGCEVFLEHGAGTGWTKQIGMVRDPDGFLLEFIPLRLLRASENFGTKVEETKI